MGLKNEKRRERKRTDLQVLVGCDPVSPHSQYTDDVMLVRTELLLLSLLLLLVFMKTNFSQGNTTDKLSTA